jgi:hypothetical protein
MRQIFHASRWECPAKTPAMMAGASASADRTLLKPDQNAVHRVREVEKPIFTKQVCWLYGQL